MANRRERNNENNGEGDERQEVPDQSAERLDLTGLEGPPLGRAEEDHSGRLGVGAEHPEARDEEHNALGDLGERFSEGHAYPPQAEATAPEDETIANAEAAAEIRDLAREDLEICRGGSPAVADEKALALLAVHLN